MSFYSPADEAAFFGWLQSIPGVLKIEGRGRGLVVYLRSTRVSASNLREFIALYQRYQGNMRELAQFTNSANASWFRSPEAYWYEKVFEDTPNS